MRIFLFLIIFPFVNSAFAQDVDVRIDETVTGNQEQPKVLYIVPWKEAEDDSILEQPLQSQVRNVFGHVERAEHQRKLQFIEVLDEQK